MSWTYRFKRPLPALYQFDTLKKALRRKRLGVFFEQRVGKTRVAIDLCGVLNARHGLTKFLIVCPKSVLTVWPDAIEQYWNGPAYSLFTCTVPATDTTEPTFVLVNYDQLRIHWKKYKAWHPDVLILDEIHYCKKHTRQRSKTVASIADITPYVLGMTGTPGTPEDGWFGIMRVIDKTVFGQYFEPYARKYLNYTRARGYFEILGRTPEQRYFNRAELEQKFADASVRVTREDAGIIDKFEDVNVPVELEPKIKQIYDKLDRESYLNLSVGELTAGLVITRDLRLHQLTGGFLTLDDGSVKRVSKAKFDKCVELVTDLLDQDKQIVVVCRFTPEIQLLAAKLPDTITITGETTGRDRAQRIADFQAGDVKVLVAQERAIAEGLDLTAAHNMVFFSVDFSLITYLQVRDRLMGRAQKHQVTYWHLVAKGTVDKDVYRALQNKEDIAEALVNARKWRRDRCV